MKNYIAGLQTYTPKLMPIHAPNINSYRRLFATWDAPRNTNWGLGNRSCGFRIPSNEEHSMRIENRISGADTNPYLVFAANLAASTTVSGRPSKSLLSSHSSNSFVAFKVFCEN